MLENRSKNTLTVDARSLSRLKCNLTTEISVAWGERWECRIIDMSQRGFGIITNAKLRNGDLVTITEPSTRARVVWSRDNRIGLKVSN